MPMPPGRVMVVGVGGVGHLITSILNRDKMVEEILAVDVSEKNLKHLLEKVGGEKLSLHQVDASESESLEKLTKDVDVVVNSAHYLLNQTLIDVSLKKGSNFISLTGGEELMYRSGEELKRLLEIHLKKDKEWKENQLVGILGLGEDPGLSNIFAKELSEEVDEVHEIVIRDADTVLDDRYVIAPLWSTEELLLSSIIPAFYYEDGEFKTIEPLTISTDYVFPEPIGAKELYLKAHPEVCTLPFFLPKGVRKVTFWYNYDRNSSEIIKALLKMGLLKREKINIKGCDVSPFDLVISILPQPIDLVDVDGYAGIEVEVKGVVDGKKVSKKIFTYISHKEAAKKYGVNGTSYLVGLPAAIGASLIIRRELKETGLLFPEQLNAKPFLEALPKHGLPLIVEEKWIKEVKPKGTL